MVKKVIYIEKEKFLRQLVETALRSKGAEVYAVETLTDNQYLIDDIKPDILILDLESSDKEEILSLINKNQETKIILTSLNDHELNEEIVSKITHFFKKPLVASNLAQRILAL